MMAFMRFIVALIAALYLFVADFTGRYSGEWEGEKFELELKQSGKNLSGSVTNGSVKFPVSGTVDGNSATGTMDIMGEKLHFKATLSGNSLTWKVAEEDDDGKPNWSEADTITFKREGDAKAEPENSRQEPKEKDKEKSEKPAANRTLANGKLFEHSSGGKFRYPVDWKLTEAEGYIQLSPPDAGAKETYLILGESSDATDPAAPEVAAYLNEQLVSQVPSMKRVGKVEHAPAGNAKGAVYTWEGDVDGIKARTKAYVTIINRTGIALVAIGPAEKIKDREPILREIFFTFGWGQGKGDPRLVGEWTHWSYSAVSGTERNSKAVLRADGTFSATWDAESSGNFTGKNQYGDEIWSGGYANRSGGGYSGTWFVRGSELTLNFSDGTTETWDFELANENGNIFLRLYGDDKKKPIEWRKSG